MSSNRKANVTNVRNATALPRGFTLIEMALVLGVVAVILGAVTVGTGLLREARAQRLQTEFIWAWSNAFTRYVEVTHHVPGDNGPTPFNRVVAPDGSGVLCNVNGSPDLSNEFLQHSVEIPPGNGVGEESAYVYQDSNGAPGELRICLRTVDWSVPGLAVGVFMKTPRHVLEIRGLSIELAQQLDSMIDDRVDARFGALRLQGYADVTDAVPRDWPGQPTDKIVAYLLVGG